LFGSPHPIQMMRDWILKEASTSATPVDELSSASARIGDLQAAIEGVIRGKSETVKFALIALLARGHLLIEDVPGIGKTTLANAIAKALDLSFQRIRFTSDLLPSDVIGLSVYNQQNGDFEWKAGPIFSNIVLADEINRATPKTQSALLEAMAEEQVTVEGVSRHLTLPFIVIASQNPAEHHGTYPLPESQLDRFLMRLRLGYPDAASEREILRNYESNDGAARPHVLEAEQILELQALTHRVTVEESLVDYMLAIVEKTRRHPDLALGVSPRGSLALFRAAQASAALAGRDYVLPDEIKTLARPVWRHRLLLRPESALRGRSASAVLDGILAETTLDLGERD